MEDEIDDVIVDKGLPRMTSKALQESCVKNGGWSAPELNEVLMLQYKGFRKIEGLQAYCNVRSLFLENNGIAKLQNLSVLPNLVSLYLQSNCIKRIENLEKLTSLQYLNLAQNSITQVENLEALERLETINLSANKITEVQGLEGLGARQSSLKSVDVSQNYIEDGDELLNFWPRVLPSVECLYCHHNTCYRTLKDYRRRLVSGLPKLSWLDERPVTAFERVGCEAWAQGGRDAEQKAKAEHYLAELAEKEKSFTTFKRVSQAAAERARVQREHVAARESERQQAAADWKETGALAEGWVEVPGVQPMGGQAPRHQAPERQQELRAKVQAFFDKERQAGDALGDDAVAQSGIDQESVAVAGSEAVGPAEDEVQEACEMADDSAERTPSGNEGTAAEQPAAPFTWNAHRDRRLGRLVAEFHYDFRKVAPALSKELAYEISTESCRQRYRELLRPSFSPPDRRTNGVGDSSAADCNTEAAREQPRSSLDVLQQHRAQLAARIMEIEGAMANGRPAVGSQETEIVGEACEEEVPCAHELAMQTGPRRTTEGESGATQDSPLQAAKAAQCANRGMQDTGRPVAEGARQPPVAVTGSLFELD